MAGSMVAFQPQLSFDSRVTHNGSFGNKIDFSLNIKLKSRSDGTVDVQNGKNQMVKYRPVAGGTFAAPAGVPKKLQDLGAGQTPRYQITDVKGNQQLFDGAGKLMQIKDKNGASMGLQYDTAGKLSAATDWRGKSYQFSYFPTGRLQDITYPDGKKTSFSYDVTDSLRKITLPATTSNPTGSKISLEYLQTGDPALGTLLTSVKDGAGNTVQEMTYYLDGPNKGKAQTLRSATSTRRFPTRISPEAARKCSGATPPRV